MSLKNKTFAEALREGKRRLQEAGKQAYAFEAELLLEKASGMNRTAFFLQSDRVLSPEVAERYEGFLSERESGRPTQYILGRWEFMGLPFLVGEGVLIPRGDTEILVETILEVQKAKPLASILEIGTGSGCIPISLSHYGSFEKIMAVDISPQALGYAVQNAEENHAEISFYESDLFSCVPVAWKGRLDAIVSNPPYIPKAEIATLMTEVKDFEPLNALDGGADGLDFYRAIVAEGRAWLKEGGWLFFEIGYDQGAALRTLLDEFGYTEISIKQDLAGLDRVAIGRYAGKHTREGT